MKVDFSNPITYAARAHQLIGQHKISPEDAAAICALVLHNSVANGIAEAYGTGAQAEAAFEADFHTAVDAVKATGLPGPKGNACVLGWALRMIQSATGVGQLGGRKA